MIKSWTKRSQNSQSTFVLRMYVRDTYYMYYDTDRVIDTKKRKPWNTTKTKLSHSFINLATPLLFFSIFQTPASVFVSGASSLFHKHYKSRDMSSVQKNNPWSVQLKLLWFLHYFAFWFVHSFLSNLFMIIVALAFCMYAKKGKKKISQ